MANQSWFFNGIRFRTIDAEVIENGYLRVFRVLQKKVDLKWKTEMIEEVPLEIANNLLRNPQWISVIDVEAKKKFGKPKFNFCNKVKIA